VTPLLAVFVVRVKRRRGVAVRDVRTRQSELVATLQEGLQAIEVVQAFSLEDSQESSSR
jgi:ABC-type multidrug transport system fused ATPase/permease subunit